MYEPTLTPRTDYAPVPRVEMVFDEVDPATETATVFRITSGRTWRVRGGVRVFAAGGFALVDTETPFGVETTYRAEMFDASGLSLGFTGSTVVTLNADGTCMHQPLDPTRAVKVDPRRTFGSSLTAPFSGSIAQPLDRSAPVLVTLGRTGYRGVNLDVVTDTIEDADAFRSMFGDPGRPLPPVICVRSEPKWRLPHPLFAAILDAREERFDVEFGGQSIDWRIIADEVTPPAVALSAGVLTYADMEANYANYETIEAAYLTYLDAESDFTLAGTA